MHHHFDLSPEVVAASTYRDCMATLHDMDQFGLCHLPYPECVLSFRAANFINNNNWTPQGVGPKPPDDLTISLLLQDYFNWSPSGRNPSEIVPTFKADPVIVIQHDSGTTILVDAVKGTTSSNALNKEFGDPTMKSDYFEVLMDVMSHATMCLITAVAASNVQKVTAVNRRAARGIGNGKFRGPNNMVYISTTRVMAPCLGGGVGTSPRPHLRRGHIHTFLVGVGRSDTRQRFVAPIFVNGKGLPPPPPRQYVVQK